MPWIDRTRDSQRVEPSIVDYKTSWLVTEGLEHEQVHYDIISDALFQTVDNLVKQ